MLDANSIFTKKMLDATRRAIGIPKTVNDEHNLEIARRVRDTRIRGHLDDCQRVRKPVKELAFRLGGWMS